MKQITMVEEMIGYYDRVDWWWESDPICILVANLPSLATVTAVGRQIVPLEWWMHVSMSMGQVRWIHFWGTSFMTGRTSIEEFCHEAYVCDGQSQGFNTAQTFLISKCWHLPKWHTTKLEISRYWNQKLLLFLSDNNYITNIHIISFLFW